ncbi:MAG: hypothetical protein LAT75_10905 [Candidatus Cyclonatronum sp.]|nr:hypothetical protein [Cyclonatronum sp.]MCH8487363.1 hypothetical protein [Cyclonatronum sp.]
MIRQQSFPYKENFIGTPVLVHVSGMMPIEAGVTFDDLHCRRLNSPS